MNAINKIQTALIAACICLVPAIVAATSFVPEEITGDRTQTAVKAGAVVYLFYSGDPAMKNTLAVNNILTVYRETQCGTATVAGKIRIISFYGNNYIRAEVVEGGIRQGDVAKRNGVSYLIIPSFFICTEPL